ncbi:hypothetical protein HG530_015084 [Fusarium avenaceum]|nr:hypothetical protein HG530_015084 [Fusarium avenaceum]
MVSTSFGNVLVVGGDVTPPGCGLQGRVSGTISEICIDYSDRHPTLPLPADPGPVKKPLVKKSPLKRLLPKEVQLQEKPLQEEPAQEHVHQGLPAGQQELQESVQDRMFNTPQAGPSQKRVRTQGPAPQNLIHRVEQPPQGLLPRAPAISNAAHARPSSNPLPWEPPREESPQEQFCNRIQAEHAAMGMSSPASTPPTAEVTRAGESQGVLLQDEDLEAFLQESRPLAPSLPEGLHTGLPLEVLFGETHSRVLVTLKNSAPKLSFEKITNFLIPTLSNTQTRRHFDFETSEVRRSRKRNVDLAILKRTRDIDNDTVESHALTFVDGDGPSRYQGDLSTMQLGVLDLFLAFSILFARDGVDDAPRVDRADQSIREAYTRPKMHLFIIVRFHVTHCEGLNTFRSE